MQTAVSTEHKAYATHSKLRGNSQNTGKNLKKEHVLVAAKNKRCSPVPIRIDALFTLRQIEVQRVSLYWICRRSVTCSERSDGIRSG